MATRITSRDFNQHTSRAKQAATRGPVYITDRGRPAHVLLTYDDYARLLGERPITDRLGEPAGVEDVDLPEARFDEPARPAEFT
ncbi:MAG: type II toxin-antitoxin system Phd/YefM family antitoxin [Actinobacteria bacterium]|jgi:prevent-host-death family protein|nr:type II toxin-antitoxin system Phd/YefM family antitoxin [Actinomycetota bacterium]